MRNLTEFSGSVKCYMVSAMTGAEVFFKFYLFVCLCIYLYINDQIVSSSECLIVCSWITIFFRKMENFIGGPVHRNFSKFKIKFLIYLFQCTCCFYRGGA